MKTISNTDFKKGAYKSYNVNLITSYYEYVQYIEFFQKAWGEDNLWFRGVDQSQYKLYPTIYRKTLWKYKEWDAHNITNEFIHKAKGYIEASEKNTKWEWYQIMQHYGCPTRLLDWTEGYLIALYFAVRNLNNVLTPCVWILNPYDLNHSSVESPTIFYADSVTMEKEDRIIQDYLHDDLGKIPKYPIAILPPYVNKRMTAQRSCFTVHGSVKDGFGSLHNSFQQFNVVQLRIRTKSAETIRNQILRAGINEATLFPDLEGLARELMVDYNMKT